MAGLNNKKGSDFMLGCGVISLISAVLFVVFGVGILAAWSLDQDRQAAQYPGAQPISSHNNYKGLPYQFRWDNAYRTNDSFPKVYNWYSVSFDLGAEARALGECILLEGSKKWWTVERHMSVVLCNTPTGRMIFVTRSTSLR